jgi:hypothetical protein
MFTADLEIGTDFSSLSQTVFLPFLRETRRVSETVSGMEKEREKRIERERELAQSVPESTTRERSQILGDSDNDDVIESVLLPKKYCQTYIHVTQTMSVT